MRPVARPTALALALAFALVGCGPSPSPSTSTGDNDDGVLKSDPETVQAIQSAITEAINSTTDTYRQLDYDYAEDLLERLDKIALALEGKGDGPLRLLPKLSPEEELDHWREVVKRWEARAKTTLRAAVDPLKAEVAAFKPEERTHPEFQRNFSTRFDDFIKVEVEEMRERRNKALHAQAKGVLDPKRESHPDIVRHFEKMLDQPPYNLPKPTP